MAESSRLVQQERQRLIVLEISGSDECRHVCCTNAGSAISIDLVLVAARQAKFRVVIVLPSAEWNCTFAVSFVALRYRS